MECEACRKTFAPGEPIAFYEHKGIKKVCCSNEGCMSAILLRIYEDDFGEGRVKTDEEREYENKGRFYEDSCDY